MTSECTVCYVADINFLLPTLVSATGLRCFVPEHKADICVFLVDAADRVEEFNRFLAPYAIRVIGMDSKDYKTSAEGKFENSHITAATLGRFFLDDFLPSTCQRLVYLDGDVWMHRDPSALIEATVPEGRFAAVEDMTSFRHSHFTPRGRPLRPYFKGLGLDPRKGYFNAGVFAASRRTWKQISSEAFSFFKENPVECRYYDQSALNAVIGDRRLRLSLKWNFQTPFRLLHIEEKIKPHIYHFHSHPKPWMGPCEPWADMYDAYQEALKPFAALNLPIKTWDAASIEAHNHLNWRKKLLQKTPLIAKIATMHLGIASYEEKAWL